MLYLPHFMQLEIFLRKSETIQANQIIQTEKFKPFLMPA